MPANQNDLLYSLGKYLNQSLPYDGQSSAHIATVTEFVKAYTRGQGFAENGDVNDDLAAVVVTASARLLASPALVSRREVGSFSLLFTPFNGFTIAELIVLNRHRQRTA